jgi:hypothetical protein
VRVEIVDVDDRAVVEGEMTELTTYFRIGDHGPANERHLSVDRFGVLEQLLDAVQVRGETGNDDAAPGPLEDRPQRLTDNGL